MSTIQTDVEFVSEWVESAGSEVDSQSLYSAYQHWEKSFCAAPQAPAGELQCAS